jgi:hypothetical protein
MCVTSTTRALHLSAALLQLHMLAYCCEDACMPACLLALPVDTCCQQGRVALALARALGLSPLLFSCSHVVAAGNPTGHWFPIPYLCHLMLFTATGCALQCLLLASGWLARASSPSTRPVASV